MIWATGFATNDFMFPMEIRGRDGLDLREVWAKGAHAHLGMTVPGFPSMFVMYGPNTNTSGGSIIWYLEQQAAYIRQALELVKARRRRRDRGQARGRGRLRRRRCRRASRAPPGSTATPGTATPSGRIVTNWPGYMRDYLAAVKELKPADFDLISQ